MLMPIPAALPPPSPPPVKTIIHVRSSPLCDAFRNLVLPLARVQSDNAKLTQFAAGETEKYYDAAGDVWRGALVLHASNIDIAGTNILKNLAPMDRFLARSWKESPKGVNPKVDAIRQRVQNIVDLQREMANRDVQFGGRIEDTVSNEVIAREAAGFGNGSAPAAITVQTALTASANATPAPAPEDDTRISGALPAGYSAITLHGVSFTSIADAFQDESAAMEQTVARLAADCATKSPASP